MISMMQNKNIGNDLLLDSRCHSQIINPEACFGLFILDVLTLNQLLINKQTALDRISQFYRSMCNHENASFVG